MLEMMVGMQQNSQELLQHQHAGSEAEGGGMLSERSGESKETKAGFKDRLACWNNPTARKSYMFIGACAGVLDCKQAELQAVLTWKARTTAAITTKMANPSGFTVEDYLTYGQSVQPQANTVLEQMHIMISVIMTVVGKGVHGTVSGERLATLGEA